MCQICGYGARTEAICLENGTARPASTTAHPNPQTATVGCEPQGRATTTVTRPHRPGRRSPRQRQSGRGDLRRDLGGVTDGDASEEDRSVAQGARIDAAPDLVETAAGDRGAGIPPRESVPGKGRDFPDEPLAPLELLGREIGVDPTSDSAGHLLGYAALGLIVLVFIVGQLVVGGVITFSWP